MAGRDISFLVKDIKAATIKGAATAAVEIMNDLVKAGPAYTGDFAASWHTVAFGNSPGAPRQSSGLYNYTLRNVPKTKFKSTGLYSIVNSSPYADEAMDLRPFTKPNAPLPERTINNKEITTGKRKEGSTRGQLEGSGNATSTAPSDWWVTYGRGGGLNKSLTKGFRNGFKQPRRFGTAQGFG